MSHSSHPARVAGMASLVLLAVARSARSDGPTTAPDQSARIDQLVADAKASPRPSRDILLKLAQLGQPAERALFDLLVPATNNAAAAAAAPRRRRRSTGLLGDDDAVRRVAAAWAAQGLHVSDGFRAEALARVLPAIAASPRASSLSVLSMFDARPDLSPGYAAVAASADPKLSVPAVDRGLSCDPTAADLLATAEKLRAGPSSNERAQAFALLGRIGPPAVPRLVELARTPDLSDRVDALRSLAMSQRPTRGAATDTEATLAAMADLLERPIPAEPAVLDRCRELLRDPTAGLQTDPSSLPRYTALVLDAVVSALDARGRAGRAVAAAAMAGDDAVPIADRHRYVNAVARMFPTVSTAFTTYCADASGTHGDPAPADPVWAALAAVTAGYNDDAPDRRLIDPMAESIGRGYNPRFRGRIPIPPPPAPVPDGHAWAAIVAMLASPDADVQRFAAHLIRATGTLTAAQASTVTTACRSARPDVRQLLTDALLATGDPRRVPDAAKLTEERLASADPARRAGTVRSLLHGPGGRGYLIDRLTQADATAADPIVGQLLRSQGHAIADPDRWADPAYRSAVVTLLHAFNDQPATAVATAVTQLHADQPAVVRAAAAVLADIPASPPLGPDTAARMTAVLGDPHLPPAAAAPAFPTVTGVRPAPAWTDTLWIPTAVTLLVLAAAVAIAYRS